MLKNGALIYFSPVVLTKSMYRRSSIDRLTLLYQSLSETNPIIDYFQRGHMSATFWGPKILRFDLGLVMSRWYSLQLAYLHRPSSE